MTILSRFLPSATVVAERLCFHKRLSFCPRGGLVDTPRQTPLLGQTPPLGRHPSHGQTPPLWADTPPPWDGPCSGRYASDWNAFLFIFVSIIHNKLNRKCVHYISATKWNKLLPLSVEIIKQKRNNKLLSTSTIYGILNYPCVSGTEQKSSYHWTEIHYSGGDHTKPATLCYPSWRDNICAYHRLAPHPRNSSPLLLTALVQSLVRWNPTFWMRWFSWTETHKVFGETVQLRIQDFPKGAPTNYSAKFFLQNYKKMKKSGPRGDDSPLH